MNLKQLKSLREETGVGVMDVRKALEESGGDIKKARRWLSQHAVVKAAKKVDRATGEGAIFSYVHQTGKVAATVKLGCETDFVAKTDDFQTLGKEIAMQAAAMNPGEIGKLMKQPWIRDQNKTIEQLLQEYIARLGENIKILQIERMSV